MFHYFFNSNVPITALAIYYGLVYIKAKMKLSILQNDCHSKEDKDRRLNQIDVDIQYTEETMKRDLEYINLLMYQ